MLVKERQRLKDVDAFTILDYIKTSIEILMNMKMEEQESENQNKGNGAKKAKIRKSVEAGATAMEISDTESTRSMSEPPKDYEAMLQKYEAEVRNHIKIE